MKRLLFAVVLFGAGAVGLGFYLGWLHIGSENSDGKDHITLTVDETKIQKDKVRAQKTLHDVGHLVDGKTAGPTKTTEDLGKPPVPSPQN